jgi:hypothetical protein
MRERISVLTHSMGIDQHSRRCKHPRSDGVQQLTHWRFGPALECSAPRFSQARLELRIQANYIRSLQMVAGVTHISGLRA